ncbi:MAG: outer membrane protein assembly factor BamC [Gammaproteobacteria bacterium]|nr:outer membrane protein assembly factor BamC [Gammaproteobacteria bacterium]
MLRSLLVVLVAAALFGLAACSRIVPKLDEVIPDKRTEYKKSKSMPDLEVPPDLTTEAIKDRMGIPEGGAAATYSTYQERITERRKEKEIEQTGQAALQKLENEQLLIVAGAPGLTFPKLREFFNERKFKLALDDADLGYLETAWRENSEELIRDKYKVHVEPGEESATTVLYISHIGEQLVPKGEDLVWQPRATDPKLAAAIATDLRGYLGGSAVSPATVAAAGAARTPTPMPQARRGGGDADDERVQLVNAGEGKLYLAVQQDFAAAWRSTADALDQVGVVVDQEDRNRGVFFVHFSEPPPGGENKKGMWSRLAFWKKGGSDGQYRVTLTGVGAKTEVVVLDAEGRWDTSEAAGQLLVRLHERLNQLL